MVTPYCFPEGSGLEAYVHDVADYLVGRGHGIIQVCASKGGTKMNSLGRMAVISFRPHLMVSNTPIRVGLVKEMLAICKKQSPDVIFAHTPVPFFADCAATVSRKTKIPLVLCYHAGTLYKRNVILDTLSFLYAHSLEKKTLHTAKKIIVYNHFLKENTLRAHKEKIVVVGPVVDSSFFSPQEELPGRSVLFAGQLSKAASWKGLSHLLAAIREIPRAHLRIAGDGDLMSHYQEEASRLGIAHRVQFLGSLSREEMPSFYRGGPLLVYTPTTQNDASPFVILESLACGTPVLTIDKGGISSLIRPGIDSVLIDHHGELQAAIRDTLQDRDLMARLRKGALETGYSLGEETGSREVEEVLLNVAHG